MVTAVHVYAWRFYIFHKTSFYLINEEWWVYKSAALTWRPLTTHSVSIESVRSLCLLQHKQPRVQIQENLKALAIWPLKSSFLGMCNPVHEVVERHNFFSFLCLSFCVSHFCVENSVTTQPPGKQRKSLLLGNWVYGWTNNSNYGANKYDHRG